MRTLELLQYLTDLARRLGYEVREEWLEGKAGGGCVLKGRKVLFVDQSLSPVERVEQVVHAVRGHSELDSITILPEVRALLEAAA